VRRTALSLSPPSGDEKAKFGQDLFVDLFVLQSSGVYFRIIGFSARIVDEELFHRDFGPPFGGPEPFGGGRR
jgi:hypothetical protein